MKVLLFTLFISTYAYQVLANDQCSTIRNELKLIEQDLMSSQLPACTEERTTQCSHPDYPQTQMTLLEATNKYNEALAEMVIYEGLLSIVNSVQESSEAIKAVTMEEVKEVHDLSNEFLTSLKKSEILKSALLTNPNDESIWDHYSGTTPKDLEEYTKAYCRVSTSVTFKEFCNHFPKNSKEDMTEYYTSLQGLVESLDKTGYRKTLGRSKFKDYREYLIITDEFRNELTEDHEGVKIIKEINLLSGKKSLTTEEKVKLKDLTEEVMQVYPTLGNNSGSNPTFNFLKQNLETKLTVNSSMTQTLFGVKNNKKQFQNMGDELTKNITIKLSEVNSKLAKAYPNANDKRCLPNEISQCEKMLSDLNKGGNEFGINSNMLGNLKELSTQKDVIEKILTCYSDNDNPQKIHSCQSQIPETKELINKKYKDIVNNLREAKKNMDHIFNSDPFDLMQLNKLHMYTLYKDKGCNPEEKVTQFSKGFCGSSDLNNLIMKSANLDDFGTILLNLEKDNFDKELAETFGDSSVRSYRSYREDTLKSCSENDSSKKNFCSFLSKEIASENLKRNKAIEFYNAKIIEERRKMQVQEKLKQEESDAKYRKYNYMLDAFSYTMAVNAPSIAHAYGTNSQLRAERDYIRQAAINHNNWQAYYEKNPIKVYNYDFTNPMYNYNMGFGMYSPYYSQNFNYPQNQMLYYNPNSLNNNFSQFSFPPNIAPNYSSGSSTGGITSGTTPNYSFSF